MRCFFAGEGYLNTQMDSGGHSLFLCVYLGAETTAFVPLENPRLFAYWLCACLVPPPPRVLLAMFLLSRLQTQESDRLEQPNGHTKNMTFISDRVIRKSLFKYEKDIFYFLKIEKVLIYSSLKKL